MATRKSKAHSLCEANPERAVSQPTLLCSMLSVTLSEHYAIRQYSWQASPVLNMQ